MKPLTDMAVEIKQDEHEIKTFPCDECNFETKFQDCLKRHKIRKHDLRKFKVPKQVVIHKEVTCEICSTGLKSHRSLLRHNDIVHSGRQFTCTFSGCGQIFDSRKKKNNHKRIHETYTCVTCGKTFSLYNQQRHIKRCKIKVKTIKTFPCDECNYETKSKYSLKRHKVRKHDLRKLKVPKQVVIHKCNTCDFKSNKKHVRDRHEKIHSRVKEESSITFLFV